MKLFNQEQQWVQSTPNWCLRMTKLAALLPIMCPIGDAHGVHDHRKYGQQYYTCVYYKCVYYTWVYYTWVLTAGASNM